MKTASDVSKVTTPVSIVINQFVDKVRTSFKSYKIQPNKDNISRKDRSVLKKLCNCKDIKISKSDKGDTVVVATLHK